MARSLLTLLFLSTTLSSFASAAIVKPDLYHLFQEQDERQNVLAQPFLGPPNDALPSGHGLLKRFDVSRSRKLRDKVLDISQSYDLDVWHAGASHIDIYFPPAALTTSDATIPQDLAEVPHTNRSVPVASSFRTKVKEDPGWDLSGLDNSTVHEAYHPYEEVESLLEEIVKLYPNVAKMTRVGLSAEGRDILALTIGLPDDCHPKHPPEPEPEPEDPEDEARLDDPEDGKKKKKKKKGGKNVEYPRLDFVVVGAQHAREWVATATSLYLAHALVVDVNITANATTKTQPKEPHSLSPYLHAFNFHIIPVPNPDGYVYTWEHDRYWYKNRQIVSPKEKCVGLDMNRNWAYRWHHEPVNPPDVHPPHPVDPCSHWYPGSRPFESPEANSIANFVSGLHHAVGFLDLRSYGQMLSYPYSYTCKLTPRDAEDQIEAAFGAVQAIKASHGTHFETNSICKNLYKAPGNIVDWMYAKGGIKYSYVAHLRDTGTHGFTLPPKLIRPVGEEIANMVGYLAKFIATKMNRKL